MSDDIYKYKIVDDNPEEAIIKLKTEVLGGNDALSFQNITKELAASDTKTLLVDMSDVDIINSSGLAMLISAFSHLKKADKTMQLINVPDKVKKVLQITQFDKIFNLK